jgi:NAD(P)-dependent dehydrogenase (short-subunit alcohol dehydrogenase family)
MVERFAGKVVIVTGSGTGIGRATILRFAREGATTVVTDVNPETTNAVAAEIKSLGSRCIGIRADATQSDEVESLMDSVIEKYEKIDVLVNNVGMFSPKRFLEIDETEWKHCLDINLTSTFLACREVIPHMIRERHGRIVNVACSAGKVGAAYFSHYSAAKHGVIGLTRSLAVEFAKDGIYVNAVCPGEIRTEMLDNATRARALMEKVSEDEIQRRRHASIPLGRYGAPDEVAGLIVFLASEDANYITGQSYNITGGQITH